MIAHFSQTPGDLTLVTGPQSVNVVKVQSVSSVTSSLESVTVCQVWMDTTVTSACPGHGTMDLTAV